MYHTPLHVAIRPRHPRHDLDGRQFAFAYRSEVYAPRLHQQAHDRIAPGKRQFRHTSLWLLRDRLHVLSRKAGLTSATTRPRERETTECWLLAVG